VICCITFTSLLFFGLLGFGLTTLFGRRFGDYLIIFDGFLGFWLLHVLGGTWLSLTVESGVETNGKAWAAFTLQYFVLSKLIIAIYRTS